MWRPIKAVARMAESVSRQARPEADCCRTAMRAPVLKPPDGAGAHPANSSLRNAVATTVPIDSMCQLL